MIIQQIILMGIDIEKERNRIERAFKNRKEIQKKLNELMDLIEAENWEKAKNEIQGERCAVEGAGVSVQVVLEASWLNTGSALGQLAYLAEPTTMLRKGSHSL